MTVENDLLVVQREEMIEKRKRSLDRRLGLLQAYKDKTITLKELKDELLSYYSLRVKGNEQCLIVSVKLTPFSMVFMDLELLLRREFVNRSDMLRVILHDYIARYSERFAHDLLANTE